MWLVLCSRCWHLLIVFLHLVWDCQVLDRMKELLLKHGHFHSIRIFILFKSPVSCDSLWHHYGRKREALPCNCEVEREVQVPLWASIDPWGEGHLVKLCRGGNSQCDLPSHCGGCASFWLAEFTVLALGSAFSGTTLLGGVGEPCCSPARVEVKAPTWPWLGWVWVGSQCFCPVWLKHSGYYLKDFCHARVPLSWSFGKREQVFLDPFVVFTLMFPGCQLR